MAGDITVLEENPDQKPVYLFGKDIRKIKCFRNSFMLGICSGIVGGLGCFLLTSKITLSTNVSFTCIWLGVLCYWIPCRYKYETSLYVMEAIKKERQKKSNDTQQEKPEETDP